MALWLILRGDLYCHALRFVLLFFSPLSIAITSLGEERAGLCAFRTFDCFARWFVSLFFVLFCFCLFFSVGTRTLKSFWTLFFHT